MGDGIDVRIPIAIDLGLEPARQIVACSDNHRFPGHGCHGAGYSGAATGSLIPASGLAMASINHDFVSEIGSTGIHNVITSAIPIAPAIISITRPPPACRYAHSAHQEVILCRRIAIPSVISSIVSYNPTSLYRPHPGLARKC